MPDHLPGDLWILKGLSAGYAAWGHDRFDSATFELLTNVVPVAADAAVGVLLYFIVRQWASEQIAHRAARWYLLNPAAFVVSGAWGQWDVVSMAVLLVALLIVLRGGSRWAASAPLVVWAILMKPQLVVPAAILIWSVLRSDPLLKRKERSRRLTSAPAMAAFAGLAVASAIAMLGPFGVGLAWTPPNGWSLRDRLQYAADLHPFTTMGAANVWMLVDRDVIGPADDVTRWSGLTAAQVGAYLLVGLWAVLLVAAVRWRNRAGPMEVGTWAASTAVFASCLALTRVHERYYFPVLVLLLLWSAVRGYDRLSAVVFWGFTLMFVVDLVLPMGWTRHDDRVLHRPSVLVGVSLLHLGFFAALATMPWYARSEREIRAGAPSATTAARRTAPG